MKALLSVIGVLLLVIIVGDLYLLHLQKSTNVQAVSQLAQQLATSTQRISTTTPMQKNTLPNTSNVKTLSTSNKTPVVSTQNNKKVILTQDSTQTTVNFSMTTTQNFLIPSTVSIRVGETAVSADGMYRITVNREPHSNADITIAAKGQSQEVLLQYNPINGPPANTAVAGDLQVTLVGTLEGSGTSVKSIVALQVVKTTN